MREILHTELLTQSNDGLSVGLGSSEVRGRMELEHEEALGERAPLAVLRIAVDEVERHARAAAGGRIEGILASVTTLLRALPLEDHLLALRDRDEIVAVLTRTGIAEAEKHARTLQKNAGKFTAPGASVPLGMRLSIGLACAQYAVPCWFQTLLAVAQEGVEVAWNSGGGRVVHSELYSFHQKRLERLSPDRPKPALPPEKKRGEPEPPKDLLREFTVPAVPPPVPAVHDLEDRVLTLAREWSEEALAKALAESHKAHSTEVDTLQRRIDKLSRALEDAQSELVRAQAGAEIDPGVASAYRTVQGLRDSNGDAAKLGMLAKLFEANLELRTLLGRQS